MLARILVEISLLLLLVILNGVFAMSEMSVVAARRARLTRRAQHGDTGAAAALRLLDDPDRFLSTVQIGITLIGVLLGAIGGATLAQELAGWLRPVPLVGRYAGTLSVALVVLATTYLSLVIGELVPKRLALNSPEPIARRIARPMTTLSRIAAPVVRLLSLSTEAVLALLRARNTEQQPVTEEEIEILIAEGVRAGAFTAPELEMVEQVLDLDEESVSAHMTPRPAVAWLDIDDPAPTNREKMIARGYSYYPVGRADINRTMGIASAWRLWAQIAHGEPLDLEAALAPPVYVPESATILQLLALLREERTPMAMVINEFGGVAGIITIDDVMDAILGDLSPSPDLPQITPREDGSWLVDGRLPLDDFSEHFGVAEVPADEKARVETVGGLVMTRLERVPRETDVVTWGDYRLEVVDMDGLRVDKVLVTARAISPPTPNPT